MSFATFAIVVLAVLALVLIVSRMGASSTSAGSPLSPPTGSPCPKCGQRRGEVDRYCRRCGQELSPPPPPQ
jgi:hypothetical protein